MLTLASVLVGALLAEAQTNLSVNLALTSPANGPSAIITHAQYTKDGVVVGEFGGTLVVLGATASISVPVTDVPNGATVEFTVPFGGTLTVYSVDPASFAFGTQYFLPNPSPGGTVTPGPGDPSTDAFFVLSLVERSDDTIAPTCQPDTSSRGLIKFTVQDVDSGLKAITVSLARNAAVDVPSFTPGTTAPVVVTATIRDPGRTTSVSLKISDEAGNLAFCKSVVLRRSLRR